MTPLSAVLAEFVLPKPLPTRFEAHLHASPVSSPAARFLRELARARQAVADALGSPAPAPQIDALDAYVPLLALLRGVEQAPSGLLDGATLPRFQWTSALGSAGDVLSGGSDFELALALLARALAHANLAAVTVAGATAADAGTAANEAAKALRNAAGSLELARDFVGAAGGPAIVAPASAPELSPRLLEALGQLCVALAGECAATKGEHAGTGAKPLAMLRQDTRSRAAVAAASLSNVGALRAGLVQYARLVAAHAWLAQLESLGATAHAEAHHADALGYAAAAVRASAALPNLEAALAGRTAAPSLSARGVRRALELRALLELSLIHI